MTKQSQIFGFIIFKLLAITLVVITLIFGYNWVAQYNYLIQIEFGDYEIKTYLGFIIFTFLVFMSLLFLLNGVFGSIISKFYSIRERYRGTKINEALNGLIESYIIFSFNNKKEALSRLGKVDASYLNQDQKEYLELLKSLSLHDSIPISLYGYVQKFPILKKYIAKKLAYIEFKLGHLDKSMEYAREYYSTSIHDEKINILLAQIYAKKQSWKTMDGLISSISLHDISEDGAQEFSKIYMEAARYYLSGAQNNDALTYCRKSLEVYPGNLEAAELFAEIASGQRNHELFNHVLISSFATRPDFNLFLIIKKFTNLTNAELYHELLDNSDFESHISLFLSIATVLELNAKQKEILDKIQ